MKFDLDFEISYFQSQSSKSDAENITISEALDLIKNEEFKETIKELRKSNKEKADEIKKFKLPSFSFHAKFNGTRNRENISELSGLIIVDIDEIKEDKIDEYRTEIGNKDCVFSVMISPSGNGLKVLYLVDEDIISLDNYRQIGSEISKYFKKYGKIDILSLTDCLIATSDKDIIINEKVYADRFIYIKEQIKERKELQNRDYSKELFEDPEEFYEKVLFDQIYEKASNNFNFIRMSVFELAKFGFSGDYDLDFILNYTYSDSNKNQERLKQAIEVCDVEQIMWPYDYSLGESKGIGKEIKKESTECFNDTEDDVIDGLVDYETMFDKFLNVLGEGDRVGAEISLPNFSNEFRWKSGVAMILGIPSSGKTEMTDQQIVDLARLHGWKTAVVGFEQTEEEHLLKLVRKVLGFDVRVKNADLSEVPSAYDFVTNYIKHVDVSKVGGDIKKIISIFEKLVKNGFKNFIIDPFNMLTLRTKSSGHEKIREILQLIVIFAKKYDVSVMLVVHPTKMKKDEKTGKYLVPSIYDANGSSAFAEMLYHAFVVYRDGDLTMVRILKVKQNNLGNIGAECYFKYNKGSGRYVAITKEGEVIDSDWNIKLWHKTSKFK